MSWSALLQDASRAIDKTWDITKYVCERCEEPATIVNFFGTLGYWSRVFVRCARHAPPILERAEILERDMIAEYFDYILPIVIPGACPRADDCIAIMCAGLCCFRAWSVEEKTS